MPAAPNSASAADTNFGFCSVFSSAAGMGSPIRSPTPPSPPPFLRPRWFPFSRGVLIPTDQTHARPCGPPSRPPLLHVRLFVWDDFPSPAFSFITLLLQADLQTQLLKGSFLSCSPDIAGISNRRLHYKNSVRWVNTSQLRGLGLGKV